MFVYYILIRVTNSHILLAILLFFQKTVSLILTQIGITSTSTLQREMNHLMYLYIMVKSQLVFLIAFYCFIIFSIS